MDEDRICGAAAVLALFNQRDAAVQRLFYTENMRGFVGPLCAHMAATRRPYRMLDAEALAKVASTTHHGGVVAVAEPRPVPLLDVAAIPRHNMILALDGVSNPHNLGAIARSAAYFGVQALLIHAHPGYAMPSDAAYRTAEGGLEYLALYRTSDLARSIRMLDQRYRSVATTLSPQAAPLDELPRDRPMVLVLGHEEHGISHGVLAACRRQVRIPGSGRVQSLNVAQSAAVMLHDLTKGNL
jgi:TrmH RNA methyltransferase